MKIKLIIILCFISVIFGQNLTYPLNVGNDPTAVESALGAKNVMTYRAYVDTISYNLWEHKYRTACHEYADSTTYYLSVNDSVFGDMSTNKTAIYYLNNIRTYLIEHMALDSCHNGSADITTVIPAARTYTIALTSQDIKEYADSLKLAETSHFGRTISTRYNYLGKILTAAYIAHCAKDTTDADSVHFVPDETYNSVTYDSTNVDSSMASWNRLKSRYNSHIAAANDDGTTEPHLGYDNTDSITTADASNYSTLYDLANAVKSKFNTHLARTDSIHYAADTNVIVTADVTKGGGHIAADTGTLTGLAHTCYNLQDYSELAIGAIGSSVSTGATFFIDGSFDDINYSHIDSMVVDANGLDDPFHTTELWKYIRVYCKYYTDGTYKVLIYTGAK